MTHHTKLDCRSRLEGCNSSGPAVPEQEGGLSKGSLLREFKTFTLPHLLVIGKYFLARRGHSTAGPENTLSRVPLRDFSGDTRSLPDLSGLGGPRESKGNQNED